jgi:FKBP-type peptidyl-prolyl cis-trans isomerase
MIEGTQIRFPTCIFGILILINMKKFLLFLTLLTTASLLHAQPGKPVAKPVPAKPAPPVLKTTLDSISYILGESAGYNLSQQGFGAIKLNMALFNRGMGDIINKKTPLLDDGTANSTINNYYMKLQQEKSKTAIQEGEQFLAKNKIRPEVKTTSSGLQYEVLREGTGDRLTALDTFVCHYRGTLINGTEFDASYNRGQPLTMAANQVIPGWTEGLQLMPVGSKYKFYIPYQLGYGIMGQGQIPGGAVLVFEVELLDFKKKKE